MPRRDRGLHLRRRLLLPRHSAVLLRVRLLPTRAELRHLHPRLRLVGQARDLPVRTALAGCGSRPPTFPAKAPGNVRLEPRSERTPALPAELTPGLRDGVGS